MRKYILVVLIFILSACTSGQKHAHQSASAATNVPTGTSASNTPISAAAGVAKSAPTTIAAPSQPSASLLSPPPIPQNGAYLGAWVNPAKESDQVMVSGGTSVEISQLAQFQTNLGGSVYIWNRSGAV
jgi:hypothetical protein